MYGTVGEDFDAAPVLRYLDVGMMRAYAHSEPITLTAEEISKVTDDYFNELLKNAELDITVEYTDGSRETRAVRFSAGCNVYGPVTRRFLAYSVDENGDPYPVHSLSEARQSFELTADIDWEQNADYRRLSKLSTDEDIIEFEDFIVEPTLKAIIVK